MHLDLQNYIVGRGSFWNLVLPAIAVVVFVVGLLVFAASKPMRAVHPGLVLAGIGCALFIVAVVGDEVGNAHDVAALESAVRSRYDVSIDYAGATDLFGDDVGRASTLGAAPVTEYGSTDLQVGSSTETVDLDRRSDGSFVLVTTAGKELLNRS